MVLAVVVMVAVLLLLFLKSTVRVPAARKCLGSLLFVSRYLSSRFDGGSVTIRPFFSRFFIAFWYHFDVCSCLGIE